MQIEDCRKVRGGVMRFSIVTQEGITVKGFTWNPATKSLCGPRVQMGWGKGWYYLVSLTKEQWLELRQQMEQLPQQAESTSTVET